MTPFAQYAPVLYYGTMKITLLAVGKTHDTYLREGIEKYLKRLGHYVNFAFIETKDIKTTKGLTPEEQSRMEGAIILKYLHPSDFVILLDEHGKEFTSKKFSTFIEKKLIESLPHLVFVIGGPYGFGKEVENRANESLSLSQMTFAHEMVRLITLEQIYRAFTIIKGEPYHHD